jgi:hypothetical protein
LLQLYYWFQKKKTNDKVEEPKTKKTEMGEAMTQQLLKLMLQWTQPKQNG